MKIKILLLKLEHGLAPYVAFGIMPIFAFANAENFRRFNICNFINPNTWYCIRLFFGKQIGVFVLSYISVKLKIADKPSSSTVADFMQHQY